jgi:putative sigma-54 modulation protein
MNIKIQSIDFSLPERLSDYVSEKVSKLERYDQSILGADVHLILNKSTEPSNKTCEVRLTVPGNDHFAKQQGNTFEEAVSRTIQALEHQIRKKKE